MILVDSFLRVRARKSVSIFIFHKVPRLPDSMEPGEPDLDRFDRVMRFALQHFRFLPLADVVKGLEAQRLPANAACLTFDDGYSDWMDGVIPLLVSRGIPATFFVTTGHVGGVPIWHERIARSIEHTEARSFQLQLPGSPLPVQFALDDLSGKRQAVAHLFSGLKYLPLAERDHLIREIERQCGQRHAACSAISQEQLRHLHSKGFSLGTHTVNHPILARVSDQDARREIAESREQLEGWIGGRVEGFAYPNGRPGTDFGARHVAMARECGYRYAVTTQTGVVRSDHSPYLLPRFTPWGGDHFRWSLQVIRNQFAYPDPIETGS